MSADAPTLNPTAFLLPRVNRTSLFGAYFVCEELLILNMRKMLPKPSVKDSTTTCPEAELLFCCARTRMDSETAERIRALLRQGLDWIHLIQIALPHGMLPLLYWNLSNICSEAVPPATLNQFRKYYDANAQRNLFMARELLNLLNLFEADRIPAVPFKGPSLTAFIYGDLSFREFHDLDILVHKRDVLRAKDLLISQGYKPNLQLDSTQEAAYLQAWYRKDYGFKRGNGKSMVELHWKLAEKFYSFPIDDEPLWRRLEPVLLAGKTVSNLSPQDLLLYLCMHGSKHSWRRLNWVCDIAELIRVRQGTNWGQVIEQSSKLGGKRMLFLGLFLANDLLGAALPADVLQKMQADPVAKSLSVQVRESLFVESNDSDSPRFFDKGHFYFRASLFYFRSRERWRDRLWFVYTVWTSYEPLLRVYLNVAVTPTKLDRAILPLPSSLSFLYYLLRPIRLAKKYGLAPVVATLKRVVFGK